ncbi:AIR synthase family protein [Tindallia californiensis]|uniref:Hydrogenase expression/formation protein HypE n=1 Tax=Tindallia californiensis TaxID=159292 RepID=A0A1H3KHV6_9FIRM|nr:AIR synthase family protein [Tindallia californiensis]SDY51620.1 hydrogenase expression/formation protein HypE [Tindallia californiensis]
MKIGKVPTDFLREKIIGNVKNIRKEVLVGAGIGEDCAVVDLENQLCVISTDPITGAVTDIGSLAIHIACNDIASNGAEPIGVMLTVLAPSKTTEIELEKMMQDAVKTAESLSVQIMGGHTEITDTVNQTIISTVAIGRQHREKLIKTGGAKAGDIVVMTKYAGLEGTAILAHDKEEELSCYLNKNLLDEAKELKHQISVVPEGLLAGELGVSAMHDATEGGVMGALWELAEASQLGLEVEQSNIPVLESTKAICHYFEIDAYRLISSGVMIMTIHPEKLNNLIETLRTQKIHTTVIGKMIEKERRILVEGKTLTLKEPEADELYRVL